MFGRANALERKLGEARQDPAAAARLRQAAKAVEGASEGTL